MTTVYSSVAKLREFHLPAFFSFDFSDVRAAAPDSGPARYRSRCLRGSYGTLGASTPPFGALTPPFGGSTPPIGTEVVPCVMLMVGTGAAAPEAGG